MLEDQILLGDYDERREQARLVMLDVGSGRERVILSEPSRVADIAANARR
jgi:hypothetical protein